MEKYNGTLESIKDYARMIISGIRLRCSSTQTITDYNGPNQELKYKIPVQLAIDSIEEDGLYLLFVPIELRTEDLCRRAVKSTSRAFFLVPVEHRTEDLYLDAITRSHEFFKLVPSDMKTSAFIDKAIDRNYRVINLIDRDHRTDQMYLTLINKGANLQSIPERLWTMDLIEQVCSQEPDNLWDLPLSQRKKLSHEFIIKTIKVNPSIASNLPPDYLSDKDFLNQLDPKWMHGMLRWSKEVAEIVLKDDPSQFLTLHYRGVEIDGDLIDIVRPHLGRMIVKNDEGEDIIDPLDMPFELALSCCKNDPSMMSYVTSFEHFVQIATVLNIEIEVDLDHVK